MTKERKPIVILLLYVFSIFDNVLEWLYITYILDVSGQKETVITENKNYLRNRTQIVLTVSDSNQASNNPVLISEMQGTHEV